MEVIENRHGNYEEIGEAPLLRVPKRTFEEAESVSPFTRVMRVDMEYRYSSSSHSFIANMASSQQPPVSKKKKGEEKVHKKTLFKKKTLEKKKGG